MNKIFLGKPFHWLLLIIVVGIGWYTGLGRMHVIEFNSFVFGIFAITSLLLWLVFITTKKAEQVTREPFPTDDELAD